MNMTIKNLPEETYRELKVAAKREGRSLNSKVIEQLSQSAEELARRRRMRESRPRLERFVARLPKMPSSVGLIREDRDKR